MTTGPVTMARNTTGLRTLSSTTGTNRNGLLRAKLRVAESINIPVGKLG